MRVGDLDQFAIESAITEVYSRKSLRALGYFVIYIKGVCYGVRKTDATMLANSYDAVVERIRNRGCHLFESLDAMSARQIVEAVRGAIYDDGDERNYFGWGSNEFQEILFSKGIIWTPDGDAFDDGGHVLHFDEPNDKVRLIGFNNDDDRDKLILSIREVRIKRSEFYDILSKWENYLYQNGTCGLMRNKIIKLLDRSGTRIGALSSDGRFLRK